MSIYQFHDYRKSIEDLIENYKTLGGRLTYRRLADIMGVQKSYLSQVLRGNAELNQDQLFRLYEFFELSEDERRYLELQLEFSRSGLKTRKDFLKNEITKLQNKHLDTTKYLKTKTIEENPELSEYYLEPLHQLIHICLSLKDYQNNPQKLTTTLGIPSEKLTEILLSLQKMGIIIQEEQQIRVLVNNQHLSKNSRLFPSWSTQVRLMAMQRSQLVSKEKTYNFTVFFSADETTRQKLQELFLQYIKEVQILVTKAPPENVYQMSFDLFSWL